MPPKPRSPADLKAPGRLMDQDAVTHAAVSAPRRPVARQAMGGRPGVVPVAHDFTESDSTGPTSPDGLGRIGNGAGRGQECLNGLAVDPDTRQVLGPANQRPRHRETVPDDETRERRRRGGRESRQWERAVGDVGDAPPGAVRVHVGDRAGDTSEYPDAIAGRGGRFVARPRHDRPIFPGRDGKTARRELHGYARALAAAGPRRVGVGAREGRPARTATASIAWAPVRRRPPARPRGEYRDQPPPAWVIRVREAEPRW